MAQALENAGNASNGEYRGYLTRIQARFDSAMSATSVVFTTDAEGLFETYLSGLPESERQHCTCHACRMFIERFGGLATIDRHGTTASPIWHEDDAPDLYKAAARDMAKRVRKAKVTGVFRAKDVVWGQPNTGPWVHFAVRPPAHMVHRHAILTAGQAMAEKREEYGIVSRALAEWDVKVLDVALTLLETEALYRSDKVKGPVRWLRDLHAAREGVKGERRSNVVWLAVATAPAGFCHPRSSMAGTLLDDIASGMSFDDASRRFAAKMHPLQYQRPQAAPTAANIAQGEKVIAALGAEKSLLRRLARLDEVKALWRPAAPEPESTASGGVFGHLKAKGASSDIAIQAPPVTITWDKFSRTVLPTAQSIELLVRPRDNYCALVSAVHEDAPPILQWDREGQRNVISWYVWNGGSTPEQFSMPAMSWQPVSAVTLKPSMWNGGNEHQGKGVVFLLENARETKTAGAALFPEILREELRAVRATIEAYSRSATMHGLAEGTACGLMLDVRSKGAWNAQVRVRSGGRVIAYNLDRWD